MLQRAEHSVRLERLLTYPAVAGEPPGDRVVRLLGPLGAHGVDCEGGRLSGPRGGRCAQQWNKPDAEQKLFADLYAKNQMNKSTSNNMGGTVDIENDEDMDKHVEFEDFLHILDVDEELSDEV